TVDRFHRADLALQDDPLGDRKVLAQVADFDDRGARRGYPATSLVSMIGGARGGHSATSPTTGWVASWSLSSATRWRSDAGDAPLRNPFQMRILTAGASRQATSWCSSAATGSSIGSIRRCASRT